MITVKYTRPYSIRIMRVWKGSLRNVLPGGIGDLGEMPKSGIDMHE
jgi:hypothetical protein